ncbi:MAG: MBL fold metallo-hydrolase [Candidatus Aenigmatarchaeota archaeon]
MIKITFLGALNEIGNSGILVEIDKEKFLLDYGLKVKEVPPKFPLKVNNIQNVIVSHSHLDHIGALPILSNNKLKIYAVKGSKEIAEIALLDNLKVLNQENIFVPFDYNDTKKIISRFRNVSYKVYEKKNVEIEFLNASHILGSAMIKISSEKSILYSGDFKLLGTTLHNGCEIPKDVDILITESTYWNTVHPEREELEKRFVEKIEEILDKGGIVLLPALAIGRTQEIIGIFGKYKINAEIYVEGMAAKITEIYKKNIERIENSKYLEKGLKNVKVIRSRKERKKILEKKQNIVIAGSGMLEGGPAVYYAKKVYNDKNSAIFLTCFQVPNTAGRTLLETKRLIVDGINKKVDAEVEFFDFSAHSDRNELLKFVEKINPEIIFLVHGENLEGFLKDLENYNAFVPNYKKNVFIIP